MLMNTPFLTSVSKAIGIRLQTYCNEIAFVKNFNPEPKFPYICGVNFFKMKRAITNFDTQQND